MITADEKLNKMGKSWFVSYCYYQRIDPNHMNWSRTSTVKMRIAFYASSYDFHKQYLEKILRVNDVGLNRNTIGLTGGQIRTMAQELLN